MEHVVLVKTQSSVVVHLISVIPHVMKIPTHVRKAAIAGIDCLRFLVRVKNSVAVPGKHTYHITLNVLSTTGYPVALINSGS